MSRKKVVRTKNSKRDIELTTADADIIKNEYSMESIISTHNPLATPNPWWHSIYKRFELFPWWLKYNLGITQESILRDNLIKLASEMGLPNKWTSKIIRHAVSEFSKKGLGADYYGYHNIDHELEATYFTLLTVFSMQRRTHDRLSAHLLDDISQVRNDNSINDDDIKYLFISALFHDYDPFKQFDKPHEESVEWFLRRDHKIIKFIEDIDININIVIAMIYRTAYPFKGVIAENARKRMQELYKIAGLPINDQQSRAHYDWLGSLLSVCERMGGYALYGIEHAKELARRNAHALGWHPSMINQESVKFFSALKEEKKMTGQVLANIPEIYRKNFYNTVESFREGWEQENEIHRSLRKREVTFICTAEKTNDHDDSIARNHSIKDPLLRIYRELPIPLKVNESRFIKSLTDEDTILITLRARKNWESMESVDIGYQNDEQDHIVGYVKGGPLENYKLRRGTKDDKYGKHNTAYMEWICIKPGYWGERGGHLLRINFLDEAKKRGFNYVSGYVHRSVIAKRTENGEKIETIQRYDPDRLDYYRANLADIFVESLTSSLAVEMLSERQI
jgi:hypothetical protein